MKKDLFINLVKNKEKLKNFSFFLNNTIGGDNISFHYRHRKQIIIGIFLLLIITGLSTYFLLNKKAKKISIKKSSIKEEVKEEIKKDETKEEYMIDIKGEIEKPGIYSLPKDSRVIDCINKAGGLTKNANTTVINLSKKISDEMVIIVYSNKEVEEFTKTKELEKVKQEKCIQKEEDSVKNDACIINNNSNNNLISLNTASIEELMSLPGIGDAKAKNIIKYREEHKFSTIEEVKNIEGIGESLYNQIKNLITI